MEVVRLAFVAISNFLTHTHTHTHIIAGPNVALVAGKCVVRYVSQVACSVDSRTM